MSKQNSTGRSPSETELLEWMKLKLRTFGWDALLAYDRTSLNESLLRDYLERYEHHPFGNPIAGRVVISENTVWEYLYAVRLGAPELSFEQSKITSARISTSARALCGAQVSVEVVNGSPKHITRIAQYSPLQAPRLVVNAFIEDPAAPGEHVRYVQADMTAGENYRFSFPGPLQQQLKGGDFLRQHMASLPQSAHHVRLNTLSAWPGGTFVPGVVRPGPVPIRDGDGNATAEGALTLLIAAGGSEPGVLPDPEGDWMYPIPSGYGAALWVAGPHVMYHIVGAGIRGSYPDAEFEFDSSNDPSTLTLTKGSIKVIVDNLDVPPIGALSYEFQAPISSDPLFSTPIKISRTGTGLRLDWKMSTFSQVEPPLLKSPATGAASALDSAWRISGDYSFSSSANSSLAVSSSTHPGGWFKPLYRQAAILDRLHYDHFPAISLALTSGLSRELESMVNELGDAMEGSDGLGDLDRIRWDGVGCPGGAGLALGTVHFPRDMVVFGNLGAVPGKFLLTPTRRRVGAGGTLQLEVTPAQSGLEWTLQPLDGLQGSVGSVSSSGVYTAPSAGEIEGGFRLVKVTASGPAHASMALVEVLKEQVALNPLVFAVASPGAQVRMSAGSQDGEALEWSLLTATGAKLEQAASEEGALFDPGDHLYVRGDGLTGGFFSVDEVTVRTNSGATRTTFVLVVEKQRRGVIKIRSDGRSNRDQVQLEFDGGGAQPIPDADWKVQIGGGSISPTGLYTRDPQSQLPYAVITAEYEFEYGHLANYLILPVPLVDLDEVVIHLLS